jgi:hypothetical protein
MIDLNLDGISGELIAKLNAELSKLQIDVAKLKDDQALSLNSANRDNSSSSLDKERKLHTPPPSLAPSSFPSGSSGSNFGRQRSPSGLMRSATANANSRGDESGTIRVYADGIGANEHEGYKSFRITVEDTCSNVLPIILRKFKVKEDWSNYALFFIPSGSPGQISAEKCLGYDENPLRILQEASHRGSSSDACFILKHIKQSMSPTERSPSSEVIAPMPLPPPRTSASTVGTSNAIDQDSRFSRVPPSTILSPDEATMDPSSFPSPTEKTVAVAVYEYTGQRTDELSLIIGDEVIIVTRSTGWSVVQLRGELGWVPSGCLVEETQAEEFQQIDPLGVPGKALFDFEKIGPNELSIRKGEEVRVLKKYQHWLLAEYDGHIGWVPSCYVSLSKNKGGQEPFSSKPIDRNDGSSSNLRRPSSGSSPSRRLEMYALELIDHLSHLDLDGAADSEQQQQQHHIIGHCTNMLTLLAQLPISSSRYQHVTDKLERTSSRVKARTLALEDLRATLSDLVASMTGSATPSIAASGIKKSSSSNSIPTSPSLGNKSSSNWNRGNFQTRTLPAAFSVKNISNPLSLPTTSPPPLPPPPLPTALPPRMTSASSPTPSPPHSNLSAPTMISRSGRTD